MRESRSRHLLKQSLRSIARLRALLRMARVNCNNLRGINKFCLLTYEKPCVILQV